MREQANGREEGSGTAFHFSFGLFASGLFFWSTFGFVHFSPFSFFLTVVIRVRIWDTHTLNYPSMDHTVLGETLSVSVFTLYSIFPSPFPFGSFSG